MVIEIRLCTHNGIRRQNSGRMSKFEKHDKVDFIVYIFTVIYIFVGASLVAQLVKNLPAMQETPIQFLGQEDPWRRGGPCNSVFTGFPGGSDGKESACKGGDLGWEDPLELGMATHFNILAWRIPMDREAWWATVHEVKKSWT